MDFERFKQIIGSLKGLQIPSATFTVDGDTTYVAGMTEDFTVGLCTPIDDLGIPSDMGVLSVSSLNSRIGLFDVEKVGCEFFEEDINDEDGNTYKYVDSIRMKQGRRRSQIHMAAAHTLKVPASEPDADQFVEYTLSKDYVNYLAKAINALASVPGAEQTIVRFYANSEGHFVRVTVGDNLEDDFVDPIEPLDPMDLVFNIEFTSAPLIRALKEATKFEDIDEATISFDLDGNARIMVGELTAVLPPENADTDAVDMDEAA